MKAGKIDFKVDKFGIIHAGIGKVSFDAAKIKGNSAFSSGDFKKAVSHYTMAIRIGSDNGEGPSRTPPSALAVLFSNRSAAHSGLKHYGRALEDAEEAIKLDPR